MAARTPSRIEIIQDPEHPVPTEVMAEAIADLAASAKRLLSGPLTERALLVLLHDATDVPMKTIHHVLVGASDLESLYVKREHRR